DIVKEVSRAAVVGQQDVWCAVVIDVRVGRAARHERPREAQSLAGFLKPLMAFIMEHQGKLCVRHLRLDAIDVRLDVSVGNKNIVAPIEVVIEKEKAKRKREKGGAPYAGGRRDVDEETVS